MNDKIKMLNGILSKTYDMRDNIIEEFNRQILKLHEEIEREESKLKKG